MASVTKNLLGRKFDRLTVVAKGIPNKGKAAWDCICDCGNKTTVSATALNSKATRSCGCLHKEMHTKDLLGKQIGKWTVLKKLAKHSPKGYLFWECKCECGNIKQVNAETLLNGRSLQCIPCARSGLKRQFCIRDHDTHQWGRSPSGACKACVRDKHLRKHYGISLEEYGKMYEFQEGKCAICEKQLGSYYPGQPGFNKGCRVEVDHDHKKTKRVSVRGLLCGGRWAGCNRRLGHMDDIKWLMQVLKYLNNPPAQSVILPLTAVEPLLIKPRREPLTADELALLQDIEKYKLSGSTEKE